MIGIVNQPAFVATPTVNPPTPVPAQELAAHATADSKQVRELDEAAKGFEQLFVQQMLKTAGFDKKMGSEGYGSMALEAMASSVTEGGGMGLAKMIRDSLMQTESNRSPPRPHPNVPNTTRSQ